MSNSETNLLALMRADRTVLRRRQDAQDLKDEDATEAADSAGRIDRAGRKRRPACPVCGATHEQHCEMAGSFTGCPRDCGAKRRRRPEPTDDKINEALKQRRGADMDLKNLIKHHRYEFEHAERSMARRCRLSSQGRGIS
jgi:hypothetical protein